MSKSPNNLHLELQKLGEAIDRLNANDSQTIEEVNNRYRIVLNTSAVVMQHTDQLAAAQGFDCSAPGQTPIRE